MIIGISAGKTAYYVALLWTGSMMAFFMVSSGWALGWYQYLVFNRHYDGVFHGEVVVVVVVVAVLTEKMMAFFMVWAVVVVLVV